MGHFCQQIWIGYSLIAINFTRFQWVRSLIKKGKHTRSEEEEDRESNLFPVEVKSTCYHFFPPVLKIVLVNSSVKRRSGVLFRFLNLFNLLFFSLDSLCPKNSHIHHTDYYVVKCILPTSPWSWRVDIEQPHSPRLRHSWFTDTGLAPQHPVPPSNHHLNS